MNFDDRLTKLNKKSTSNKSKHVETKNKITDLINKVPKIKEKGHVFLLHIMYFTGNNGYQNFLVFAPIFSSLILDSNKKVTNWISTRILSEKIKPFYTNLELTMCNLANGKVILKISNSFSVQNFFSSLYSNFIFNLYIVYELNTWPRNLANNFTLKNLLFRMVKLMRNAEKIKFT